MSATETERFSGAIGAEVTATPKVYEGYCLDPALSNTTGTLTKIEKPEDIVTLKLYYAVDKVGGEDGGDGTRISTRPSDLSGRGGHLGKRKHGN